jgi:citrate synthase
VALKACTETAHAIDVTAESLYEAIAQALATLRGEDWVGEIGRGLTTH